MTDFIADLEAELVAAARRRSAGRRPWAPRLGHLAAAAAIALVAVAAVLALARLDGSRPADEAPVPPPGPGVTLPLPAAEVARTCEGLVQRPVAPKALPGARYAVFSRGPAGRDRLPDPTASPWLPARTIYSTFVRRAGFDRFLVPVHLVPVAGLRRGCERAAYDPGGGVCLVAGGPDTTVRCFAHREIRDGRAIALTRPGMVHGMAPDRVKAVTLTFGADRITAPVVENAYEIEAPVKAGETVRVEMVAAETCGPSPDLRETVPALQGTEPMRLPAAVEEAVAEGGIPRFARRMEDRDGFELWVLTRCEGGAEIACLIALREGRWIAQPCGTAGEIRSRGTSWLFPVTGRLGVAGLAPPGTDVAVVLDGGAAVHRVATEGGAFAALLPAQFGSTVDPGEGDMSRRVEIRYR